MKDFVKWLGVNEKIAKVVVWLLIIMVSLIIINTALDSLGLPYYKITYDNLKNLEYGKSMNMISRSLVCILNFYATMLLVFRIKETKKLFKWAMFYLITNWLITGLIGYIESQVFIFIFFVLFPYFYSNKNKKYIIYGIGALALNTVIQGITYYFKARLIDITAVSKLTRSLLSIDYFIIMAIIILVKELYIKKRGERK